ERDEHDTHGAGSEGVVHEQPLERAKIKRNVRIVLTRRERFHRVPRDGTRSPRLPWVRGHRRPRCRPCGRRRARGGRRPDPGRKLTRAERARGGRGVAQVREPAAGWLVQDPRGVHPPEPRARGVVAASAGNHAQGVALAARELGIKATVFMPADAALPKLAATRDYGAEVVLGGASLDEIIPRAHELAERTGATFIHP